MAATYISKVGPRQSWIGRGAMLNTIGPAAAGIPRADAAPQNRSAPGELKKKREMWMLKEKSKLNYNKNRSLNLKNQNQNPVFLSALSNLKEYFFVTQRNILLIK